MHAFIGPRAKLPEHEERIPRTNWRLTFLPQPKALKILTGDFNYVADRVD